jgi:3-oxoacyl-[acyl-carrier-protein] synthase II
LLFTFFKSVIMELYINGTSSISAFDSRQGFRIDIEDRFTCIEPDYKLIIDLRQLRRMSRIMRMALASAIKTLEIAKVQTPQAVITATGLGCLDDTGNFLIKMCDPDNRMMNPTAFIQSIHNTMGGQIAMHLKSNCYNNTFTQDVLSFEHALLDTIMLLEEGIIENVLLGGIDELTELKHELTSRLYKAQKVSEGYFGQGEGSTFFSLSAVPSRVKLATLILSQNSKHTDISDYICNHLALGEKTLILTGKCGGNSVGDYMLTELNIGTTPTINYKKYCGDYPTSCAFATWLACEVLQQKVVPNEISQPEHVLIYHAYSDRPQTLIHLSGC